MFIEPERTQFDLSWRMFGVPVRVHPLFWLVSAILGWDFLRGGFQYLFLWILCVFVSILLHELGHVFAGRLFGAKGHVILYAFGGLAVGSSNLRNRWQRTFVYFAGPLAQFLLLALVFAAEAYLLVRHEEVQAPLLAHVVLRQLFWINLFWPLLNLLPIWPLDGGRISREVLDWLSPENGVRASLGVSICVAGLLAVNSLMATYGRPLIPFLDLPGLYNAIFFAMFAVMSYQALEVERRNRPWDEDRGPWSR